jgi:hypothetical protein
LLNGEINVSSELGKGSEFIIKLPVEFIDKKEIKEISTDIHKIKSNIKLNILVIDDDKTLLSVIKSMLNKLEISCEICHSSLEFDKILTNINNYDLTQKVFYAQLNYEEINIIATYMMLGWFDQQLASVEVSRMKFSGSDFKFTSQANHMAKLKDLRKEYERIGFHLQRLYKRRKTDANGNIRSTFGSIMATSVRQGNVSNVSSGSSSNNNNNSGNGDESWEDMEDNPQDNIPDDSWTDMEDLPVQKPSGDTWEEL